jgi:hypothetical protein
MKRKPYEQRSVRFLVEEDEAKYETNLQNRTLTGFVNVNRIYFCHLWHQ